MDGLCDQNIICTSTDVRGSVTKSSSVPTGEKDV